MSNTRVSFNGRTPDSESVNGGSIPPTRTTSPDEKREVTSGAHPDKRPNRNRSRGPGKGKRAESVLKVNADMPKHERERLLRRRAWKRGKLVGRRLWAQVHEIDQRLSVALTPNEIRVVCRALGELIAANDESKAAALSQLEPDQQRDEPDRDAASEIWNRLQKGYRP